MTVSAALLRELHRIHRQLSDLRSRLERGPRQIKAAEANVQKADQELLAAKEHVKRTRLTADQKELQLKEREGRISDIRVKLNACSTNREYQAFVEQIAADEQANSVLSDEILELFDKVTELQAVVQELASNKQKLEQEFEAVRKRISESRATLEMDVARLSDELVEAENRLPVDFRRDYDRVAKSRGEEALAPLDGGSCGGCYTTLTAQTVNELMLSKPIFCKSCGRILYLPEGYGESGGQGHDD
jgi:predicted  nucleic acid-binding Zn-ribbon protein